MTSKMEASLLYKGLAAKCSKGEADPLNSTNLLSMLTTVCTKWAQVLNRTSANFPDYTLHDEDHAIRVMFLMYRLMGLDLINALSPIDISLLILSAYGHDIGMGIGREKRDELRNRDDYKDFLLQNEDKWIEAENARESGDDPLQEHLGSQLFQDYLRDRHHLMSADLVEGDFAQFLTVDDKSLARPVADLCRSHGQSVEELLTYKHFPFAGCFSADLQFLACVLRLADYLDLDPARAPASLMELIHPATEKSRREWRKHQANNFLVTDKTIEFTAKFSDYYEEKALRDTLRGIEKERRACMEFLRARPAPDAMMLRLDGPVKKDIESKGYIYEEFRFRLEYKEIMALLMGTRLYKDERVFIRELLQNALDACRHAEAGALAANRQDYSGKITIRKYVKESGQEVLEVSDNGSGMTRTIIRDYFMRVGRSYYQSFAFRRKRLAFRPVSEFGIGILSCFMRSQYIELETCPDPFVYPDEEGPTSKGLRLEIRGPHQFFVVREVVDAKPGTTVRVFLDTPLVESLTSLVQRFLSRTPYTVEILDQDKPLTELQNQPFDFSDERFSHSFVEMPGSFGYAWRDVVFDGKFGFELKGRIRLFMLDANDRKYLELRDAGKYAIVGFGAQGETLINVERLTDEVRKQLNLHLNQVRILKENFSDESRSDIETIIRHFDRMCDQLMRQYDVDEVRSLFSALTAQIGAMKKSEPFCANPASIGVNTHLSSAILQVDSFVTGKIKLSFPSGILTQDGINLSSILNLPPKLTLAIGFLYNLDLCGKHKLTLNAARDSVLIDENFDSFIRYIYAEVGACLGQWFREEYVPSKQVTQYVKSVPKALAEAVRRSFDTSDSAEASRTK